jgi:hypothetical protein
MRIMMLFFGLFFYQFTSAQAFSYPKLAVQANSIAAIVPSNWAAIDTIYGDLNNDHREDMVLILEFKDQINEVRAYGDADTEIIKEFQRPRIMGIYFKNGQNHYTFALQNNNFILREKEGGIYGDPYEGISITQNVLHLNFIGGSNWRWKLNYHFKYQNQDWVLIGAKNRYYHNASGELDEKEYNFITKKVTETIGNFKADQDNKTVSKDISVSTRTLATFKKPWTWEIMKDNFL